MTLTNLISKLGNYARKNTAKTLFSAAIILVGLGISNQAQATIKNDTIWGEGMLITKNIETNNDVRYVELSVRPTQMQDHIPDTIYYFTTNNGGGAVFSQQENPPNGLPVLIDIVDNLNGLNKQNYELITTHSGEINAFFKEQTRGSMQLYDMQGKEIINANFNADNFYFNASKLPTGAYIARIQTENGDVQTKKFIKNNDFINGPLQTSLNEEKSMFKDIKEEYATYMVKWEKEGYFTDSIEVIIGETFDWYDVYLTQIPPLTQDIIFNIKNLDQENLENVLVYLKYSDTGALKDSARTNSQGQVEFLDNALNEEYLVSIGELESYKAWEEFDLKIPEEITNLADTSKNANASLYPDQVMANGELVDLTAYNVKEIFNNYNIMASVNDGVVNLYYDTDSFSSGQLESVLEWQDEFTDLTGIVFDNNFFEPFDFNNYIDDFNPYTINPDLVGSNISKGPNQTQDVLYYLTPTGEATVIAANDITVSVTNREGYFKELLRMLGYKEGGGGCMAGIPQPINNEEVGMINTNYSMGRARFNYFTHNTKGIRGMDYLEDELDLDKKSSISKDNNPKNNSYSKNKKPNFSSEYIQLRDNIYLSNNRKLLEKTSK